MSQRHCIAAVENLETRLFLSATLKRGTLSVIGTDKSETIVVERSPTSRSKVQVTIGREKKTFNAKGIKKLVIDGRGGNDAIILRESRGALAIGATISGSAGNDSIVGGSRKDQINGGLGNDVVSGNGGNDILRGGEGGDGVAGGKGNDQIKGDAGDDFLYGDAGDDNLMGGDGNDIMGGDEENTPDLIGGAFREDVFGNDRLDGGAGDDWLLSGVANSSASQGDKSGADIMIGGTGADVIDARGGDDTLSDLAAEDFVPMQEAIPVGAQHADSHNHANLVIFIEGANNTTFSVFIPTDIGIFNGTMTGLHTHDSSGRIHDETGAAGFALKDFFRVWGMTFDKRHVGRFVGKATMLVNGAKVTSFENYRPANEDDIEIRLS